jgi:hypothetical protein
VNGAIFTVRPWCAADGSAGHPQHVLGIGIDRRLCRRVDEPGAFVALVDHRYALTGAVIAVGPAVQMQRFLRRRAQQALPESETAWFELVHRALIADILNRRRPPLPSA